MDELDPTRSAHTETARRPTQVPWDEGTAWVVGMELAAEARVGWAVGLASRCRLVRGVGEGGGGDGAGGVNSWVDEVDSTL